MKNATKPTKQQSTEKARYNGIYQLYIKRVLDVFFCLLALPFALIVIAVAAILIKLEDRGPILYRSKRIGKDFREFDMLKLRSMSVNAPDIRSNDGSTYNSENDFRVTRIGKILRATSADEIPQIFNVLAGQMSIVGPRAGDVESKDTYAEDEKGKTLVRPGITGYTQAYYRNSISVREKRLLDARYAENVTFALDVKILFKTVFSVLKHENLYTNSTDDIAEGETVHK